MQESRISVVGVGGGGCNVVACLAEAPRGGPILAAVNTDARALAEARVAVKLQIGEGQTGGLGTGGDVELGRQAASDDTEKIRALFADVDLVFVVATLGGGTGTGATPVLLNTAREAGAITLCFAALPFKFEGRERCLKAEKALASLREAADALVVVPNDRLFDCSGQASVAEAFRQADRVMGGGIRAIWKLLTSPGYINLDFADFRRVAQSGEGTCTFGYGEGTGRGKSGAAVQALLDSPLLERGQIMAEARSLLVSIVGGPDLAIKEVGDIMETLSSKIKSDCRVFMGTVVDEDWLDRITITVLTRDTGVDPEPEDDADDPPTDGTADKAAGAATRRKAKPTQTSLRLELAGKGRFKDVEPTMLDGEDLDIPTFIRRGLIIDK